MPQEKIDYIVLRKAAMVLRAVNHKLRQQIMKLIEEKKKIAVTDIYVKLRIEQSVASQHLAILRRAKVVKTEREGKHIYYMINQEKIAQISKIIKELVSD